MKGLFNAYLTAFYVLSSCLVYDTNNTSTRQGNYKLQILKNYHEALVLGCKAHLTTGLICPGFVAFSCLRAFILR